jgi:hypothetical protein
MFKGLFGSEAKEVQEVPMPLAPTSVFASLETAGVADGVRAGDPSASESSSSLFSFMSSAPVSETAAAPSSAFDIFASGPSVSPVQPPTAPTASVTGGMFKGLFGSKAKDVHLPLAPPAWPTAMPRLAAYHVCPTPCTLKGIRSPSFVYVTFASFTFPTRRKHSLTLLQLPNAARPQQGVEMTWDMKAQSWLERQVTIFFADRPFAEGAMNKSYYMQFERNDSARGGDRVYVCISHISRQTCVFALFHPPHTLLPQVFGKITQRPKVYCQRPQRRSV